MKSVNPDVLGWFIPDCDRDLPPAEQTAFEYANLTHDEYALLKDLAGAAGTQIDVACHLGLTGKARNFVDESGQPIEWVRDTSKPKFLGKKRPWSALVLNRIPFEVRDQLAARIIKGVEVSEAEAKNS